MATVKEKISSCENLFKAERRAARSKRKKVEVARFEYDLGYNIVKLSDELEKGTYRVSKYYCFYVYEPKEREIQALKFRDRVVQNCICNEVLRPWLEPRLIYDNAACRVGKGSHFALKRLSGFLSSYYRRYGADGYVLKIDIKKYFDSIDHEVLKKKLSKFPTKGGRELFYSIVDGYHKEVGKGLPMGNQSSQWFALYYLDGVDRMIKEVYRIKYYTRYMDDMVLIHHDRAYLAKILDELRTYADKELKLQFNSKTQIAPLSQGVDFLGFRFFLGRNGKVVKRLRGSAKKRLRGNIKRLRKAYANGEMDIKDVNCRINSYVAHLKHGNTYNLRKRLISRTVFARKTESIEYNADENKIK